MPSYSPTESQQCPILGAAQLGLSQKSFEEFQARENTRLTNINENWDLSDPSQEEDEDELLLLNDDDEFIEHLYSDDEESEEEDCFFHFNTQDNTFQSIKKTRKDKNKPPPFWYSYEDPHHLSKILAEYTRELNPPSTQYPSPSLKDKRRLSTFIGRISRCPVLYKDSFDEFTTLDKVDIFRRDKRMCGSSMTCLEDKWVVTSWDEDGMPENFIVLTEEAEVKKWRSRVIRNHPVSIIYCLPVWQSESAFKYSVEKEKHDVGYANQPFNYTQYLPKHLLSFPDELEVDI